MANATWLPDVDNNGKRATLRCKHGFYGKEIEISCTNNGTWTEFEDHDPCYPGKLKSYVLIALGKLLYATRQVFNITKCVIQQDRRYQHLIATSFSATSSPFTPWLPLKPQLYKNFENFIKVPIQ